MAVPDLPSETIGEILRRAGGISYAIATTDSRLRQIAQQSPAEYQQRQQMLQEYREVSDRPASIVAAAFRYGDYDTVERLLSERNVERKVSSDAIKGWNADLLQYLLETGHFIDPRTWPTAWTPDYFVRSSIGSLRTARLLLDVGVLPPNLTLVRGVQMKRVIAMQVASAAIAAGAQAIDVADSVTRGNVPEIPPERQVPVPEQLFLVLHEEFPDIRDEVIRAAIDEQLSSTEGIIYGYTLESLENKLYERGLMKR